MYYKILINIFFILTLLIFQLSFIGGLPFYLDQINFFFIVLIFILSLAGFKYAFWWSVFIGFFLDIISFGLFGVYLFSYLITIIIINYLYKNYFTDRSLYSFSVLITIALVFNQIIFKIIFYIFNPSFAISNDFFLFDKIFWLNILFDLIVNFIAVFILFYFVNFLFSRLRPVFLIKK